VTRWFRTNVRASFRRIRTAIARINSYLQEHITGMSVLQLFNREEASIQEFETINRAHMEAFKDAIFAHALFYPAVEVLSAAAIAGILWYGGFRALSGVTTLGVVVAFTQYAQRFYRPIMDLSEKYNVLQEAMASSERIFKLLDTPVEIVSPAIVEAPTNPRGRIEFQNVWFAYQDEDWVLRDVSFTVEPGQVVEVGHVHALQMREDLHAQVVHHSLSRDLHGVGLRVLDHEGEQQGDDVQGRKLADAKGWVAAQETVEKWRRASRAPQVTVNCHFCVERSQGRKGRVKENVDQRKDDSQTIGAQVDHEPPHQAGVVRFAEYFFLVLLAHV